MTKAEVELLKKSPENWSVGLCTKYSHFILKHFKEIKDDDLEDGCSSPEMTEKLKNLYFDPKLSKMVELVMKCGYIPVIDFVPMDSVIREEPDA